MSSLRKTAKGARTLARNSDYTVRLIVQLIDDGRGNGTHIGATEQDIAVIRCVDKSSAFEVLEEAFSAARRAIQEAHVKGGLDDT